MPAPLAAPSCGTLTTGVAPRSSKTSAPSRKRLAQKPLCPCTSGRGDEGRRTTASAGSPEREGAEEPAGSRNDAQAFLWLWVVERVEGRTIALAVALLVVGLHRRLVGLLIHRVDGVWHLTRAGVSLGLGGMVLSHYVLDMNPTLASLCAESLVLITVTSHPRVSAAAAGD